MTRKRPPESDQDNVAENDSAISPADKFKALARRLTKVSRQELEEQLKQHEASKPKRKR